MFLKKNNAPPETGIAFGRFALAAGQVCLFTAFVLGAKARTPLLDGDFSSGIITLVVIAAVLFGISVPLHINGIIAMRRRIDR